MGLHLMAPFVLPCGPIENVSDFHGILVSGGGSRDVLTFSFTGPCIWLFVNTV